MSNGIQDRLCALRAVMERRGVDVYLIPTDDFHGSEYVGDFFKCRKFITGFTGSAGTAVVTRDMAGLWTDGRYFLQAEQQLFGSGVELFKSGEPGVPTVHEFLRENMRDGQCLGFDGRTVNAGEARRLQEELRDKKIRFQVEEDLVGEIWTDRPPMSCEPAEEMDLCRAGRSRRDKLEEIRKAMREKEADLFLLATLDDIAWLLNIRGNDIHCCPVVLSFLALTRENVWLFAGEKAFSPELASSLGKDGVKLCPYDSVYDFVSSLKKETVILLNSEKVNHRLYSCIPEGAEILDEENLTLLPKAVKNPTEVENERIAHIKDGVALTKFIYWLKTHVGKVPMTELSLGEKLYELRSMEESFRGNSFDPIISYGAHGAIVHYSATPETDVPIQPQGMVLADTGGHYLEGSTDVTRTIVVGPVTEEEKKYFTLVLRGHLNLAAAKFRYGCTGMNLDYLARAPLWEIGEDYNHGTGHGVGYYLNVHESPNGFRWKKAPDRSESAVLEEGMITSDEPGYYAAGRFGIRHESLLLCKKAEKTPAGQFMCFEYLTMAPIDLDGVAPERMSRKERELLNAYHRQVCETLSPFLEPEEREWLRGATRPV
ncbi:MAG: aminopeptidase P family protein [Clostridiales bacterium]|nr:aminopeptidase P family protein [Clostridiales bacterium]